MKIIFFGSDDFAAVHLEQILACGHEVLCCVTSVDKPQGRGMKMGISPIKKMALEHNIPCLQPASLKSQADRPDLESLPGRYFCRGGFRPLVDAGNSGYSQNFLHQCAPVSFA